MAPAPDLPPFTSTSVFTAWGVDPVLLISTVWVATFYLYGVWRLR